MLRQSLSGIHILGRLQANAKFCSIDIELGTTTPSQKILCKGFIQDVHNLEDAKFYIKKFTYNIPIFAYALHSAY